MKDTFEFTLNNPLTEEQWDMISDVDFDQTDRITFHTKHGKEVEFTKVIRCKDCTHQHTNTITGTKQCLLPNGYTPLGDDNDYCSYAERKPPQVNPEMVKALKDRIEKQRGEDAKRKS